MRSRLALLAAATTVALPLLAACGGSGSSGSTPSAAGSGSASASASPAESGSGGAAVTCAAAPAALVGSALGDTVSAAEETRNGDTIVVCDYKGPKVGLVKLRIQTDADAQSFAADKKGFATQSMPTKDEDFADEAFSNVLGSGSYQVTTLVARRGEVVILVAAKAGVPQEKALLSQLFNRL